MTTADGVTNPVIQALQTLMPPVTQSQTQRLLIGITGRLTIRSFAGIFMYQPGVFAQAIRTGPS
jgi:hypothetical protein